MSSHLLTYFTDIRMDICLAGPGYTTHLATTDRRRRLTQVAGDWQQLMTVPSAAHYVVIQYPC